MIADMKREPMTPIGHARLLKEVEQIKHIERPANIKAIEEARSHGDLSENADYDAAKNEQGLIAGRLSSLEDLLSRAEVIDPKTLSGSNIMFGATVTLSDSATGEEITYKILGGYEAEPKKNIISVDSPIGKALIGKIEGDEVSVQAPGGTRQFIIEQVQYK
jgi:transcription elongation factor GreA